MKSTLIKVGGVVGIVAGSILLYVSGTSESVVTSIVAGAFVLAGIIASLFKDNSNNE